MFDQEIQPTPVLKPPTPAPAPEADGGFGDLFETMGNAFMAEQVAGTGCEVTVQEGDTLSGLARRHLGDGRSWPDLYERNRGVVGDDPNLILPGQVLDVCGGDEDAAEEVVEEAPAEEAAVITESAEEGLAEETLSPEEQLAAAQEARAGLEDQITALDGVDEDQREAILSRVNGLEGEALVREMALISHTLESENADRALNAYADIQALREDDDEGRLTDDVVSSLVRGVADRRTESDRGREGVLNRRQAVLSAQALLDMTDEQYTQTTDLLARAGTDAEGNAVEGADADVERSLILKAVASRAPQMEGHWYDGVVRFFGGETESDQTMGTIADFADDIRGTERDELIRTTTLIDIDDQNTSTVDPLNLRGPADTRTDNDGLYQRWDNSCGPTTAQIVRGEADPMYALSVHRGEGVDNGELGTDTANEQRRVLEENGGTAVNRLGLAARADTTTVMNNMMVAGTLNTTQRDLVNRLMNGETLSETEAPDGQAALEAVRAANNGHPTDAELAAVQFNNGRSGGGMGLEPALDDITQQGTGIDYETVGVDNTDMGEDLDDMEQRLRDGEDIPFRIGYGATRQSGHFMSVTDVRRGDDGSRSFLVTDPWSGATRWVSEADFTSGAFANSTFTLGSAAVTHVYHGD